MSNLSDQFSAYLASRGRQLTHEKSLIVEQIAEMKRPFDHEMLIDELAKGNENKFGRATVYRTVSHLLQAELIREVSRFPGQKQFMVLPPSDA
jgi:Fe2+ or Zn2+ uptake regulation protein